MGRTDGGVAVGPGVTPSEVVGDQYHDVRAGLLGCLRERGPRGQHQREQERQHERGKDSPAVDDSGRPYGGCLGCRNHDCSIVPTRRAAPVERLAVGSTWLRGWDADRPGDERGANPADRSLPGPLSAGSGYDLWRQPQYAC